jgi:metal-sulfur cluster biosynthetic enzyme
VTLRAQALDALSTVYDPELDEPITTLGFVSSCVVGAHREVEVRLRLPTPQCAPNFAYLMVADARNAVRGLPEAGEVTVVLEDHYTGAEINAAVGRGAGFDGAFPGETDGDLDALRSRFQRKALLARQARVCQALVRDGTTPEEVAALTVADLPDSPDVERCIALRAALGLPHGPDAPAVVADDGGAIGGDELPHWLRRAQLVNLSLETNGSMCRDLLRVRYGEEVAR